MILGKAWFERVDPGTDRRIKGLRLVTAYSMATLAGLLPALTGGHPNGNALSPLAAGFALWASVSEGETSRARSTSALAMLCLAATLGATAFIMLAPMIMGPGRPGAELILVSGSFCVGYFRRFGVLGAGVGSQIYLGELYASGTNLTPIDLGVVSIAGLVAAVSAIVPRLLSGPAERPAAAGPLPSADIGPTPYFFMGLQGAAASLTIVMLQDTIGLMESVWAITACTYVIATSKAATLERASRRILGTSVGVPLGLACLPLAADAPLVIWSLAAVAMMIYAMALPERYDIACGAFAFTLIVTLAAGGEHSLPFLFARLWETALGATLGLIAAMLIGPIQAVRGS